MHKAGRNRRLAAAVAADPRPQYLIAAESLISPSAFANIVAGRLRPTPAQQAKIGNALGVHVAVIFGEDDLVVTPREHSSGRKRTARSGV